MSIVMDADNPKETSHVDLCSGSSKLKTSSKGIYAAVHCQKSFTPNASLSTNICLADLNF